MTIVDDIIVILICGTYALSWYAPWALMQDVPGVGIHLIVVRSAGVSVVVGAYPVVSLVENLGVGPAPILGAVRD
jgi:hypothetical protein